MQAVSGLFCTGLRVTLHETIACMRKNAKAILGRDFGTSIGERVLPILLIGTHPIEFNDAQTGQESP